MREPSAEELDAAHQLVSSARGAQDVTSTETNQGQGQSDGESQGPVSPESLQGGDGTENGQNELNPQELYPQVVASLGQTCR